MTPNSDEAITNYQKAYEAFFGEAAPAVRKLESGGFSVRFVSGSKRYRKAELVAVTGMMISLQHEVA